MILAAPVQDTNMQTTRATVHLTNPVIVMEALRSHLAEHEIELIETNGAFHAELRGAKAVLRADGTKLALEARATSQAHLEEVTAFLAAHVLEFAHPEVPSIRWDGMPERQLFADFRELRVTLVTDITPHMRRVTLAGDNLFRFATSENLHVRLYFPQAGTEPEWPVRGPDGLPLTGAFAGRFDIRKYTIRRIDPASGELDIDFVLHDDAGPGSGWAARAVPDDRLGMAGPGGRSAKAADWVLLAGDETALPAIARILEELPATTRGYALIEVTDEHDHLPLRRPDGVVLQWLHRRSGETLKAATHAVAIPTKGSRFCWAGAEFEAIQAIRQHWRDHGLSKHEELAVSYWRRGTADA
ncbi:siderophore-interacting protein [Tianweitania populi]|uniref:Siderophore-interacting protein n=2 Tax=Tianweitania populi TaxID=1607949 RepID=A0A8J3E0S0_9HYPH|nr:siderophore-interacting protein [Tianweitania populi]